MKHPLLLLCLTVFLVSSCKKSTRIGDHFIFGIYHSECGGNCASYFMLKNGKVYPDDMNSSVDKLKFKSQALSQEKTELAKKLEQDLPTFLANTNETNFGCPDCRDQGGLFLQIKKGASTKTMRIDVDTKELPQEIKAYVLEMQQVLGEM